MVKRVRTPDREAEIDEFAEFCEQMSQAISIDPNALDEALVRQPDLFFRVSERLAIETSLRDQAKDELKFVEGEIDEAIRSDEKRDKKPSEAEISRLISTDGDVRKQQRVLAKHSRNVMMLSAIKESYAQRSYMLKELVSLFLANYYGDSSERSQSSRAVKDAKYDDNRRALNEERKRRREN